MSTAFASTARVSVRPFSPANISAETHDNEVRVMIVEDDPVFLQRFCRIVDSDPDFELVGAYASGQSALDAIETTEADMMLVDLGLPDFSGTRVIHAAHALRRSIDIMVVSVFGDEAHVLASIEAGATGYLLKDSLPSEFIDVMKQLRDGGSPISPVIARRLLNKLGPKNACVSSSDEARPSLTGRESEILTFIGKGFSFGEIGNLLDISAHTVTTHVKKIYQKLCVHSRGEAVYEASRLGLIR